MKTFSEWLLAYKRNNRIGDLAADVRRDPPAKQWDYADLLMHLQARRACREAFDAAMASMAAYSRYVAKITPTE